MAGWSDGVPAGNFAAFGLAQKVNLRLRPNQCILAGDPPSVSGKGECTEMTATQHQPARFQNILWTLVLAFSVTGAAAQQGPEYRGTEQQQIACTPDVFRLCWSEIPNVSQIVTCLIREKPRLSEGCRAAFGTTASRPMLNRFSRRHPHHIRALNEAAN
jgi:hypothetical protein